MRADAGRGAPPQMRRIATTPRHDAIAVGSTTRRGYARSMKRRGLCPKCEGSVIYVPRVAESHDGRPEPMRLVALAHDPSASVGDLEAGVCRECGFVELYVKNPEAIPLDGETAWLLARDTPYR